MTTNTSTTTVAKAAMFQRLEGLRHDCRRRGCNLHDQVIALISACIDEGLADGSQLVGTVAHLGYKKSHVGWQLRDKLGHFWERNAEGVYVNLPSLALSASHVPHFNP
jgi:hypothetical protein